MDHTHNLLKRADAHMRVLCLGGQGRHVGGRGNRQATGYFRTQLRNLGWETEDIELQVLDWETDGASLACGQDAFEVAASPYSLGCSVSAELCTAASMDELEAMDARGKILLLHGSLAREQIMPKNFVFYNPDEHRELIRTLETSGAIALICATGRNPELAGGVYPFPMFEDGDFDLPSVYMKDTDGERLLSYAGQNVCLESRARRVAQTAYNVSGSKQGSNTRRVVITAHIDAKQGTPGALDNATGVTVLLLLAELLRDQIVPAGLELVALNGEDYYAASGQMQYLARNEGRFDDILLNINVDGVGYREGPTSFCSFDLDESLVTVLEGLVRQTPQCVMGRQWYEGDHSIFLQQGTPAVAVTSEWILDHMHDQAITHTPEDTLDKVDTARLVEAAEAIYRFVSLIDTTED